MNYNFNTFSSSYETHMIPIARIWAAHNISIVISDVSISSQIFTTFSRTNPHVIVHRLTACYIATTFLLIIANWSFDTCISRWSKVVVAALLSATALRVQIDFIVNVALKESRHLKKVFTLDKIIRIASSEALVGMLKNTLRRFQRIYNFLLIIFPQNKAAARIVALKCQTRDLRIR